ncbi:MAG: cysteine desulfurase family protein [Thermoanaerobacterales bacterium]|nr:cysteine desulfurase family protein [Thermoanaerobacterales bacterium]
MRRVYLDHNATTPVRPEVVEAMLPFLQERFGNPSSIHSFGREAREGMEKARGQIAAAIGADAADIVFTSGGTEADFLALKGVAYHNRSRGKHIIISAVEHHAVLDTCAEFLTAGEFDLTVVPVDRSGIVDPDAVRTAIRPGTILISVMYANNEVGSVQPVPQIAAIAREHGVIFHTDAVQCLGKIPVNVRELNADLVSLSSHKVNGPKGAGALWIRPGTRWAPINHGGGQERARRPGTENVPGIVGFGEACSLAVAELEVKAAELRRLRDRLVEGVYEALPGVLVNGEPERCLPNTAHFCIAGADEEAVLTALDAHGIAVSAGSACVSGSRAPSHVLTAMGVPAEAARCSLRVSLGYGNTDADVEYFVQVLRQVVAHRER